MTHQNPEEIPHQRPNSDPLVSHDPCTYFIDQYGRVANEELEEIIDFASSVYPDPREIPRQAVAAALAELPWYRTIEDPRVPSQRVYDDVVNCTNCRIADLCPIKAELETTIELETAERQMHMLASGPRWLTAGRLHRLNITAKEFAAMMSGEVPPSPQQHEELTVEALIGSIHNRQIEPFFTEDLPTKLAKSLASTKNSSSFETHEIEFANRPYAFAVSDLSSSNGYTGLQPTRQAYGILITKFLDVMKEIGPTGRPAIMDADLQKVVRYFDGGHVTEIRMAGKSRLYAAICVAVLERVSASGKPMYHVLILGAHGDNEQDQERFYKETGLSKLDR